MYGACISHVGLNFDISSLDYKLHFPVKIANFVWSYLYQIHCFFEQDNLYLYLTYFVAQSFFFFFEVFFFCHCRYIYDTKSELCYPPEVIGKSSLSPIGMSEEWKAKKSPKHWLVCNCQTAAPENRILLTGTFAFYFLPWNAQCVQSAVNVSTI